MKFESRKLKESGRVVRYCSYVIARMFKRRRKEKMKKDKFTYNITLLVFVY